MVFYNLACSCSLTDRIDESITALNKAVHLGYDDSKWMDTDPDLNKVRTDPLQVDPSSIDEKAHRLTPGTPR